MPVSVVDDVLVDLVHDGVYVVLDAQIRDDLQLIIGEHLAAGVGGVADEDGLGTLAEGVLQHIGVKPEGRGDQRHKDGLAVSHNRLGVVVLKIGGENDDLVPGVGEGEDGVHHGLGGADGHDDLPVRVQPAAHEAAALPGQGRAEVGRAHGDGVLVGALVAHLRQPVHHLLGGIEVGESLGQIDGPHVHGDAGHPADDGVCEEPVLSAHFLHGKSVLYIKMDSSGFPDPFSRQILKSEKEPQTGQCTPSSSPGTALRPLALSTASRRSGSPTRKII